MNNLHRELAPITEAAWAEIEQEARRTFKRNIAGRRIVDLVGPDGPELAAVGTGHLEEVAPPADGVLAHRRQARSLVQLRAPFSVTRDAVDDVERGSQDSDWQPVKDAARQLAFAEDQMVFQGSSDVDVVGIGPSSSNAAVPLPGDVEDLPDAVAQALTELRLAGVDGPYSLLLSADLYTEVSETTDHGYPIREHIARMIPDGQTIWAPALTGALLVSTRGGDYALHLGQDVSIGYLSHDSEKVDLYLQESLTFLAYTAEASVPITTA